MIFNVQPSWIELLFVDHHQEYVIPKSKDLQIRTAWDGFAISQLIEAEHSWDDADKILEQMAKLLPQKIQDLFEGFASTTILHSSGSIEAHAKMLKEFCNVVFSHSPSGNDDTYDYWPNAVSVARAIAKDLDEITKTDTHTSLVKTAYEDHLITFGAVSEYWWDDDDKSLEAKYGGRND